MVTTIKITCDGVFIQSNSFLSGSQQLTRDSVSQLERQLRQVHSVNNNNHHHNRHHQLHTIDSLSTSRLHRSQQGDSNDVHGGGGCGAGAKLFNTRRFKSDSESDPTSDDSIIINGSDEYTSNSDRTGYRGGESKKFTISFLNTRQPKLLNGSSTGVGASIVNGCNHHHHQINNDKSNNKHFFINNSTTISNELNNNSGKEIVVDSIDHSIDDDNNQQEIETEAETEESDINNNAGNDFIVVAPESKSISCGKLSLSSKAATVLLSSTASSLQSSTSLSSTPPSGSSSTGSSPPSSLLLPHSILPTTTISRDRSQTIDIIGGKLVKRQLRLDEEIVAVGSETGGIVDETAVETKTGPTADTTTISENIG